MLFLKKLARNVIIVCVLCSCLMFALHCSGFYSTTWQQSFVASSFFSNTSQSTATGALGFFMDERNAGAIAWFVFSGWASIESWRHHGFISAPSSTSPPLTPLHPPHGVDEWLEHDVLDFLSARNVSDTILHAMQSLGLNGHSLMLLDNQTFHNIGIAASELQHLLAEIETLRLTVQAAPLDFWEWRAVNLRLFDMWLMPLSLDPRTLLAWARLRG